MHQVLFQICGKPIYTYGVMAMLGLLAAVLTWWWMGRREREFGGDFPSTLAVWLMLPGIVGARLAYVVANWSYFAQSPSEIVRTDHGGLIFYGGFVAACLAAVVCARIRKLPVAGLFDFAAPGLAIGHAFGRIGCLSFGCCYGGVALPIDSWYARVFGVTYPAGTLPGDLYEGMPMHPVQVYEAAGLLLLWAFLLIFRRRMKPLKGLATGMYLVAYGMLRFGLEFLRGDVRQHAFWGMDVAQAVSVGLVLAGVLLSAWALLRKGDGAQSNPGKAAA